MTDIIDRLSAMHQAFPVTGGGSASPNGPMGSYISDDGMRLVNPDGPAAIAAIQSRDEEIVALSTSLLREGCALHDAKAEIVRLREALEAFGAGPCTCAMVGGIKNICLSCRARAALEKRA